MLEIQQGQTSWVPVIFQDSDGLPVNDASYTTVTVSVRKADGTEVDITATEQNFIKLTGAAYLNQGYYNFLLPVLHTNVPGIFQYCVVTPNAQPYFGVIKVAAGDTTAIYNRLGAPNYGTIKDDIANVGIVAGEGGFTSLDRTYIQEIKLKTDALPSDPTSTAHMDSMFASSFNETDRITLNAVKMRTDYIPSDAATNIATHNEVESARQSIAGELNSIKGLGFSTTTDSLHALSASIADLALVVGGEGGFIGTDRDMLISTYNKTLNLPYDPASYSFVSGVVDTARAHIMGASQGFFGRSVQDLAGTGFVDGTETLHGIYGRIAEGNFTQDDRNAIAAVQTLSENSYDQIIGIRNRTDNLPVDPVSTVHIDPQLAEILAAANASGGFSTQDRDNITSILSNTNRLPLHPADATVTFNGEDRTKLNFIQGKVTNLTPDPASNTQVKNSADQILAALDDVAGQVNDISISVGGIDYTDTLTSIDTKLGEPATESISSDIAAIQEELKNSLDTSVVPSIQEITKILGKPVKTVSRDVYEVARLVSMYGTSSGSKK